jgi:hypothetical protein
MLVPAGGEAFGPYIYQSPAQDELLDPPPALQPHSKSTQVRSRGTSVRLVLLDLDPPPPLQDHFKGTQVDSRSTSVGLVRLDLDPPPAL